MRKGTILSRIVSDIALSNYLDESPLSDRINYAIEKALPDDIREWFLEEIGATNLSGKQGLKLVKWLFSDHKKAIIDLKHIRLIRQARREQIVEIVRENLPTPAVMANVTKDQLEKYNLTEEVASDIIDYLATTIRRDRETVIIALQWATNSKHLTKEDINWLRRYSKPIAEYTQLLLF